ncbi:hypothetical protein Agub_g3157 [Astrephomene gubernaculifera]|uniref:Uncharacterized protein n=1 Tax=Astrephomene gubernaculifera TaxID=47775 RepID=A0AAD3HIX5_9CHLO|nr:hypothetical protein Agub_g3157 [Astrephomene gubernaculifera]
MAAPEEDATPRKQYSPEEVLKQLEDIPEDKRTFSASRLLTCLSAQRDCCGAVRALQEKGEAATLADHDMVILLFLKNMYNLVSGLPGALQFDALEDLMARSGILLPFVNGMRLLDQTVVLQLGLPSKEQLCDNIHELIRVAATAIVCFYHYTNYPAHPDFFPSDDAALLFSSLALASCQPGRPGGAGAVAALEEQLAGAGGGVVALREVRWLMHYFRAQLSSLGGSVFLSLGDTQQHSRQLVAQQADLLGLIKAVPENPAGYAYYVRTCLQFQQLAAAKLFAEKGAVVAAKHNAVLYGAILAAQQAIALALAGGGKSSTGSTAGKAAAAPAEGGVAAPDAASSSAVAAASSDSAPPAALVLVGELRGLMEAARGGLEAEKAGLPEVYGDLVVLDPTDSWLLAEKLGPLVAGVPDEGEVLALSGAMYPTRQPTELPRGAVAVKKPQKAEGAK